MIQRSKNYLKDQDKLGSPVYFNYKGSAGFGTITGGVCSIIVNIFFALFVFIQLYAWQF